MSYVIYLRGFKPFGAVYALYPCGDKYRRRPDLAPVACSYDRRYYAAGPAAAYDTAEEAEKRYKRSATMQRDFSPFGPVYIVPNNPALNALDFSKARKIDEWKESEETENV